MIPQYASGHAPVAVRYAWSHGPCTANKSQRANVLGKNGLPVGCFRSDNWKPESAPDVVYRTTILPAALVVKAKTDSGQFKEAQVTVKVKPADAVK
jgi:hypothetical protein